MSQNKPPRKQTPSGWHKVPTKNKLEKACCLTDLIRRPWNGPLPAEPEPGEVDLSDVEDFVVLESND